ncbi:hypothetical protein MNV49_001754 [Pseudohyphozyma bogoriensis]|nr:hypothetical protein MNV49_001754 [Pseudohyphozyma bogoriensis]
MSQKDAGPPPPLIPSPIAPPPVPLPSSSSLLQPSPPLQSSLFFQTPSLPSRSTATTLDLGTLPDDNTPVDPSLLNELFTDLFGTSLSMNVPPVDEPYDPEETQRFLDSLYCLDAPQPTSTSMAQNAVAEFHRHCSQLGVEAARASSLGPTVIPEMFNCTKGRDVLELLPTAFIWLNAYKLIDVRKTTGDAFLSATGINIVDLSDAVSSIKSQLGSIRERSQSILQAFLNDSTVPILSKLTCLYDIAMTEVILDGASACAKRLDQISDLVLTVFPPRSTLNLNDLEGFHYQAFAKWVGADIVSSILRNRRTCFIYTYDESPTNAQADSNVVRGLEWLFGSPDVFMCALAAISNLGASLREDLNGVLSPDGLIEKQRIFDRITTYNPQLRSHLRGSSFYNVARIAAQEVWRQSCLIHYYQVLEGLLPESPVLQTVLQNLLQVYSVVEQGLPALLIGPMTLPLFLASTIAITPEQQHRLRGRHDG